MSYGNIKGQRWLLFSADPCLISFSSSLLCQFPLTWAAEYRFLFFPSTAPSEGNAGAIQLDLTDAWRSAVDLGRKWVEAQGQQKVVGHEGLTRPRACRVSSFCTITTRKIAERSDVGLDVKSKVAAPSEAADNDEIRDF